MFYFDRRLLANVDWLLLAAAAGVRSGRRPPSTWRGW